MDVQLNCCICMFPFRNPIIHQQCKNIFCYNCTLTLDKCPICRGSLIGSIEPASLDIQNTVNSLMVTCSICKSIFERNFLKNHFLRECRQQCPQPECESNLPFFDLVNHYNECGYKTVNCSAHEVGCNYWTIKKNMEQHITSCPYAILYPVLKSNKENIEKLNNIVLEQDQKIKDLYVIVEDMKDKYYSLTYRIDNDYYKISINTNDNDSMKDSEVIPPHVEKVKKKVKCWKCGIISEKMHYYFNSRDISRQDSFRLESISSLCVNCSDAFKGIKQMIYIGWY